MERVTEERTIRLERQRGQRKKQRGQWRTVLGRRGKEWSIDGVAWLGYTIYLMGSLGVDTQSTWLSHSVKLWPGYDGQTKKSDSHEIKTRVFDCIRPEGWQEDHRYFYLEVIKLNQDSVQAWVWLIMIGWLTTPTLALGGHKQRCLSWHVLWHSSLSLLGEHC